MPTEIKPSDVSAWVRNQIEAHGAVTLPGIGKLTIKDRRSHPCKNPRTGEAMMSAAKRVFVLRNAKAV